MTKAFEVLNLSNVTIKEDWPHADKVVIALGRNGARHKLMLKIDDRLIVVEDITALVVAGDATNDWFNTKYKDIVESATEFLKKCGFCGVVEDVPATIDDLIPIIKRLNQLCSERAYAHGAAQDMLDSMREDYEILKEDYRVASEELKRLDSECELLANEYEQLETKYLDCKKAWNEKYEELYRLYDDAAKRVKRLTQPTNTPVDISVPATNDLEAIGRFTKALKTIAQKNTTATIDPGQNFAPMGWTWVKTKDEETAIIDSSSITFDSDSGVESFSTSGDIIITSDNTIASLFNSKISGA